MIRMFLSGMALLFVLVTVAAASQEAASGKSTRDAIRGLAQRGAASDAVSDSASDSEMDTEVVEQRAERKGEAEVARERAREPNRVDRERALDRLDAVREQARARREVDRERARRVERPAMGEQFIQHGNRFVPVPRYSPYRYSGYRYGWPYYGYGSPYLYGGYPYVYPYGYGFGPVAFGISGPETIRYADPLGRQHRLVDEGIRKFAENPTGVLP